MVASSARRIERIAAERYLFDATAPRSTAASSGGWGPPFFGSRPGAFFHGVPNGGLGRLSKGGHAPLLGAPAGGRWKESELQLDGAWRNLRERLVLSGHEDTVFSAAFSPDGKRIVTASDDNTAASSS